MMEPVIFQNAKSQSFTIRPMARSDVNNLLVFANTLIDEDIFLMMSGKKLTMQEETKYVSEGLRLMKKNEKLRLVAVYGGAIIGSAEIRRGDRRKHHVGEIGISILKPYRGMGIGNTLMKILITEGKKMGLVLLMLTCFENNSVALALYKNFGFIRCGLLPDALEYHGKLYAEVTLYKKLSAS